MENSSYKMVWKYSKNHLNCFKCNIFCPQNFSKHFREYIRTENPSHKIAWNCLKISWIIFMNFAKKICEYIRKENPGHKIAWNHSKVTWIILNTIFFDFQTFSKDFREYIRMKNLNYKNKSVDRKCLKKYAK